MNMRSKNVLSFIFFRPWLGIPFGIWIAVSVVYYWWLISRISILETQNKVFKTQLRLSQSVMSKITVDSATLYQVPDIPDESGTLCETIHVALVCMGKCPRLVTPMLKSLLHHRQNPVHFHLIADAASQHTISPWVPNSHYSGIFALVKLLFPDILPSTLKQVIVLDSDITFLCDVVELWAINWYYDTEPRWPALGRGYNTGVMLLDLTKIRTVIDWTSLWHDAVNENIDRLKVTTLADQDVINAIIKKIPKIVYNISCQYNVQMSTNTLAKNCYGEDVNNVKIIHWNSPKKYNVKIRDVEYFRSIHQSYVNFDGNILREKLHRCYNTEAVTYKTKNSDLCVSFRAAQRTKLRTHLYYMDYSYTGIDNFDVTLVLQLAAIYLSDCDVAELESFIRDFSDTLSTRKNIGYHLVFKQDSMHYPVNYLRNVALESVNTPYVFLVDVDFVPMAGLYEHLRTAIRLVNPYPQKKCLVVAAFETQRYRLSPPRDKPALLARLAARRGADVAPFRAREWPRGHRATNYSRWAAATAPYE
ncbi:hypothetical protein MSG28_001762, partial [Choristoneura fumiferana]